MSFVLLKTFLAIVDTGSLVKASRQLNITQSTVTSRLKTLEMDVGQTLLHRQKSGVSLTASGIKFKRYAEAMSNMWQQALIETSLPAGMAVMCNLGCEADIWDSIGRKLIDEIKDNYPDTALTMKQGNYHQIGEWLSNGMIDVALTYRATNIDNFTSKHVATERLAVFSTQKDGPIHHDPNYTYFDAGSDFGANHAAYYTDAGVAKNSFDNAAWCLDYILRHGGSAYLPENLAHPYVADGQLHRLDAGKVFTRNIYLITNDTALFGWPWLPELAESLNNED